MRLDITYKPTVPEVADVASGMVNQLASPLGSIAHLSNDVFDSAAGLYRLLRIQDSSQTTPKWENNHLWIGLNPT